MKYLKIYEDFNEHNKLVILANKMFEKLHENYSPESDLDLNALIKMRREGLVEYDSEVDHDDNGKAIGSYDFYWFTALGAETITSPEIILNDYLKNEDDEYARKEKEYFNGSEGNG